MAKESNMLFDYQVKKWQLTGEGCEVAGEGSHEARVYNLIPNDGIEQVFYVKYIHLVL